MIDLVIMISFGVGIIDTDRLCLDSGVRHYIRDTISDQISDKRGRTCRRGNQRKLSSMPVIAVDMMYLDIHV